MNPKDPEVLNGIGVIHFYHKRYRDAAAFFTAASQQQPPYLEATLNLAILSHQYLNNKPLALEKYHSYISVHPRPANAPAVEEVMVRLDMELNPQKYATNQPPSMLAKTNAPVLTNAPAVVQVATAAPPAAVTAPNARNTNFIALVEPPSNTNAVRSVPSKTVTNTVASANPVTAVKIPATPTAPASNPVTQPVVTTKVVTNETIATPSVTTQSPANTTAAVSEDVTADASKPAEKRGFFQRINPLNLFRSQPKPTTPLTPVKVTPTVKPTVVTSPSAEATAPGSFSSTTPLPKQPVVPHYAYLYPAKPEPGNRREATSFFEQGLKAQRENNFPVAVAAYRSAIQADPSFFVAQFNLGLAAYDADDLPASLRAYETALAIDPISVAARYNFALSLQKSGYYRDAANELEKMLAVAPTDIRGHLALANLYAQRLSDRTAAREHYQKVLQLNPHHAQAEEIRYWLIGNP